MHRQVQLLGRYGSRVKGVWRWVTRWRVGVAGEHRIIEVYSETRGVDHA